MRASRGYEGDGQEEASVQTTETNAAHRGEEKNEDGDGDGDEDEDEDGKDVTC